MSAGAPILETVGLRREFAARRRLLSAPVSVKAVDGVDLRIRAGETFAIVGESGCGKSTLARLLVGLIPPTEGAALYRGRDMARLPSAEARALRRELQFVFQDPFSSLNPRMNVGALIEEPLRAHGIGTRAERRERAAELLRRVGLSPTLADRYPHEFSGGQRQRIGIARALATGPAVVVADEPVSALDVSVQAQIINLLAELKEAFGLTLVVIAHDLAVIRHMADRVAVMYLGRIVETAPADEIFARPRHPYTEALVASIPLPRIGARGARPQAAGEPPNPIAPPPGCRFHPRCAHALRRCASESPALRAAGPVREAACLRLGEIALAGLAEGGESRSPAAERRFALYRAARGAEIRTEPTERRRTDA